jgi:metallo-beta-lactamase family protein
MLTLQSFGAVGTVTGSLHIFTYTTNGKTTKFGVDAGMFQTGEIMSEIMLNSQLGFDPGELDAWILSHAHLDHTGRLAYVVKRGFKGPIYATQQTQELANIVMTDGVKQMQNHYRKMEENEYNRIQQGKAPEHSFDRKDVELYNDQDVDITNQLFVTKRVGEKFEIAPGLEVLFFEASHILGSVFMKFTETKTGKTVYHSADIGFSPKPFLKKIGSVTPDELVQAVIMESTYGDRVHATTSPADSLAKELKETLTKGGQVIIPSFAIQRSQELLYYCASMMQTGKIPSVDIFLDSPMAINATEVYTRHVTEAAETVQNKHVRQLVSPDQSKELNYLTDPCIIVAGSGMMNGGRIWQHLRFHGNQSKNKLLVVGYQAEGTHGRELLEGKRNFVIDNKDIHIALSVIKIEGFSGHADQSMLLKWLTDIVPQGVYRSTQKLNIFLVHGEDSARDALATAIQGKLKSTTVRVYLPSTMEVHTLID